MMPTFRTEWEGNKVILVCELWRSFPPEGMIRDEPEKTADHLWKSGAIDGNEYQRCLTWERICGKHLMNDDCPTCEKCRRMIIKNHLPVMVTLDGKREIPTTDIPTMEGQALFRSHLRHSGTSRINRVIARGGKDG